MWGRFPSNTQKLGVRMSYCEQDIKYYLYQITNKINGKIYIGVHQTEDINDGYMGSGVLINKAFDKYGLDNFEKTILKYFNSSEEMFNEELKIVNSSFIKRSDVYNICEGGKGFSSSSSKIANDKRKWLLENDDDFSRRYKKILKEKAKPLSKEQKLLMLERKRELKVGACHDPKMRAEMVRRAQTPEAVKKRNISVQGIGKGEKNSQFGTIWITNGTINKKIKKDEDVPFGFKKGRILANQIKNNVLSNRS